MYRVIYNLETKHVITILPDGDPSKLELRYKAPHGINVALFTPEAIPESKCIFNKTCENPPTVICDHCNLNFCQTHFGKHKAQFQTHFKQKKQNK